jgi:hypothetical protein
MALTLPIPSSISTLEQSVTFQESVEFVPILIAEGFAVKNTMFGFDPTSGLVGNPPPTSFPQEISRRQANPKT